MSEHVATTDQNRAALYQVLPLDTPLGITISPCNICDFRCIYCGQGDEQRTASMLTLERFHILADQLAAFPRAIKQVSFVANGETILNPELPDMIALLKQRGLANQIKIITNANRLTHNYADRLIDAGLDTLKVSLQGITSEKYQKICKTAVDFDRLKEQLFYFYDHRKQCSLHIKVIDIALDEGEEEQFYRMFDDYADSLFVEQCIGEYALHPAEESNKFQFDTSNMKICSLPFYTLFIDDLGYVFPCCLINRYETSAQPMGNVFEKPIKELWDDEFRALQQSLLQKQVPTCAICQDCKRFAACSKPSDIIDGHEQEILERMHRQ